MGIVFISGVSCGIGWVMVLLLVQEGYIVVVNYYYNINVVIEVVNIIVVFGGKVMVLWVDISDEVQVMVMFEVIDCMGELLMVLVNNVGILFIQCMVESLSVECINCVLVINVIGYFFCCCEVVKCMLYWYGGKGGVIVNVLLVVLCFGVLGEYVDYVVLKGVVDILIIGLVLEVVVQGIWVNGVCLGLIYIEMYVFGGELGCVD